jgi:predicted pyridoxine 5'-phosphate oxidase superfamily flavin-nucleotide-binding protein
MTQWPFHVGELEAQVRAGGGARGGAIRAAMPDQHRAFFEALPFVVVASLEAAELGARAGSGEPGAWPVATIWAGAPGFVTAPDAETLRFAVPRDSSDPAAHAFAAGAPFGLLGIELATRRRNRANGVITAADARGVAVAVHQSFGNCPQYIQPRELRRVAAGDGVATERFDRLDAAAAQLIARADTFFVATAARIGEPTGGVDISHRGGPPGFVRVDGDVLTIPDFKGNRYFNTLGNLVSEPRAALLFIDFPTGDLLHVQGTTEIVWSGPEVRALDGAERLWRIRVERGWRRRASR